jgi:hypothetical protein
MDVIDIKDLPEWRNNNPNAKFARVRYSTGIADLIFNVKDPKDVTISDSIGAYDGFGKFHFIDKEGTKHICYPTKPTGLPNRRLGRF